MDMVCSVHPKSYCQQPRRREGGREREGEREGERMKKRERERGRVGREGAREGGEGREGKKGRGQSGEEVKQAVNIKKQPTLGNYSCLCDMKRQSQESPV